MKYFVVSDIHGFYSEFKNALDKAGFNIDNENHKLVVCGDIFDRGKEALNVYHFLKSIPKNRLILIRGNHDYLLVDLVNKDAPSEADFYDGTFDTLCQLAKVDHDYPFAKLKELKIIKDVVNWINSKDWHYYYEVNNYIFVHSFIPLRFINNPSSYIDPDINKDLFYDASWRKIKEEFLLKRCAYDSAWRKYKAKLFEEEIKKGKTLVCGHTHSCEFFKNLDGILDNYSIYYDGHIINLDGWVEKTHHVNVLIIGEDGKIKLE